MQNLKRIRQHLDQQVFELNEPLVDLERQAREIVREAKRQRSCLLDNVKSLRQALCPADALLKANLCTANALEALFDNDPARGDLSLGMLFDTGTRPETVDMLRTIHGGKEGTQLPSGMDPQLYQLVRDKIRRVVDVTYTITAENEPHMWGSHPEHVEITEEVVRHAGSGGDNTLVEAWRAMPHQYDKILDWINSGKMVARTNQTARQCEQAYAYVDVLVVEIPAVLVFVEPLEPEINEAGGAVGLEVQQHQEGGGEDRSAVSQQSIPDEDYGFPPDAFARCQHGRQL